MRGVRLCRDIFDAGGSHVSRGRRNPSRPGPSPDAFGKGMARRLGQALGTAGADS
jgi:hypothetical protein